MNMENFEGDDELRQSLTDINKDKIKLVEKKKTSVASSCWNVWIYGCQKINRFFDSKFTSLGYCIANHPTIALCTGLILSLLCMLGFFRFHNAYRVEDLYIPQGSQALKDLERGHKSFGIKFKAEEFIIVKNANDRTSMIDDQVFQEALKIHSHVITLPGLHGICAKFNNACIISSPLEIFQFQKEKLSNVIPTLNHVYKDQSILLSNGRKASYSYPDFFAGFAYNASGDVILRANALRNVYFVKYAEDDIAHKKQLDWEDLYIAYMTKKRKELKKIGLKLYFSAGKSLDGSISDSSSKDIQLIPVSFLLMVTFCMFTLARFRNHIIGHFLLGNGGIMTLAVGIGAAFGFGMLLGAPYVAFAGVLPFLILGVGIDNMFIITDCLDRQQINVKGPERIAKAFGQVGASITMTTLTDLVAFGVSMVTDFPAIKYFCLFAALSITICYLLVISVFIAMLTFDVKRIETARRDFFPWMKLKSANIKNYWQESQESITNRIMMKYATILMGRTVRYIVLVISIGLVSLGVFGALQIDQSFNMLDLGLKGSDYLQFYEYRNRFYPNGFAVSVIVDEPLAYSDTLVQNAYSKLDKIPLKSKYMTGHSINWMTAFLDWCLVNNETSHGLNFQKVFPEFLKQNPMYYADMKFENGTGKIAASRVIMQSVDNDNSIFRKNMMLNLRDDLSNSDIPAYPIHMMFIYIEQFVVILRDTIRNLSISAGAILLITLPYLMHPLTTFFVFFGFISLIFELLGMMYIWNVSLNSISMIVIVMAIGFAVDYSAHVAHAYMVSTADTPEKRVIDALRTMGASVLMGGTSTFIGIIVTAFASSEIFKIFFKMVFGIVILGLLHGLCFLPVHLSIFCRTDLRIDDDMESAKVKKENTSNLNEPEDENQLDEFNSLQAHLTA